jgi:hypothetical protein
LSSEAFNALHLCSSIELRAIKDAVLNIRDARVKGKRQSDYTQANDQAENREHRNKRPSHFNSSLCKNIETTLKLGSNEGYIVATFAIPWLLR